MLLAAPIAAHALDIPAKPQFGIADPNHVLADDGVIERALVGYAQGTTTRYGVAIFKSLGQDSVEDVSIRIADAWKIGSKKDSNGVLLAIFVAEHKIRIEVGYGLEAKLTDVVCARIIRDVIAPKFRAGDLAGGITAGLEAIDQVATGRVPVESNAPIATSTSDPGPDQQQVLIGFAVFLGLGVLLLVALIASARRRMSGASSGWSSAATGGFVAGSMMDSSSDSSSSSSSDSWSDSSGGGFGGGGASGDW